MTTLDKILELLPIAGATDREERIRDIILTSTVVDINKLKADSVREAQEWLETMDYYSYGTEYQLLVEYANKLEQGEI